jgi:hypothetical protein
MSARTIVCLANSWKDSGRCVAGKEIGEQGFGGWIRPVSARPARELSDDERRVEGRPWLRLLDVVEIPVLDPAPAGHQIENIVIDASRRWVWRTAKQWEDLHELLDDPPSLWIDGHSTRGGVNDRVKARDAEALQSSLALIAPRDLRLEMTNESGRQRVRAHFHYRDREYRLSVTDPGVQKTMTIRAMRELTMVDTYLCVSLSEPYVDHWCYKLAAAVLSKRPV